MRRVQLLRTGLALGLVLAFAACNVATLSDATGTGRAQLSLVISGASVDVGTGGIADAFQKADHVSVKLTQGTQTVLNETVPVSASAGEIRVPLSVDLNAPTVTLQLQLQLLQGSTPLFDGTGTAQLQAGQSASVQVELTPVPSAVGVHSAGSLLIQTYGDTLHVSAVALFSTGDTIPGLVPTWTSLDPNVATITSDGVVTGLKDGTAGLVAGLDGLADTVTVTVHARVASVVVAPAQDSILVGDTCFLSATATDARGNVITGRSVTWTSSDPAVVSVDTAGTVVGLAQGSATVTASVDSASGGAVVTVLPAGPSVPTSITGKPTFIGVHEVDFAGQVAAGGGATSAWFEWSRDTSFVGAQTSPTQSVSGDTTLVPISFSATGLFASTDYYYRVVASNSAGTSYGAPVHVKTNPEAVPTVTTDSAKIFPVDSTTADVVFYGTVVPNGLSTSAYIQIGYDSTFVEYSNTKAVDVGSGSKPVHMSGGMQVYPGYTLYYRTVAVNSLGTSYGKAKTIY